MHLSELASVCVYECGVACCCCCSGCVCVCVCCFYCTKPSLLLRMLQLIKKFITQTYVKVSKSNECCLCKELCINIKFFGFNTLHLQQYCFSVMQTLLAFFPPSSSSPYHLLPFLLSVCHLVFIYFPFLLFFIFCKGLQF